MTTSKGNPPAFGGSKVLFMLSVMKISLRPTKRRSVLQLNQEMPPAVHRSHLTRIIGLLMLSCLLSACSAIKVVYNQSPQLAYWWLDDYLDFTNVQSPQVRTDLIRLQQWHQRTQLPGYADLLQKVALLMPTQVSPTQVCSLLGEVQSKVGEIEAQVEPAIVTMALSLNADQIHTLNNKYTKNNATWREDWIDSSDSAQAKKRYNQVLDRAKTLYGRITDTQKDLLHEYSTNPRDNTRLGYGERIRRQQDTAQILEKIALEQPKPEQARALVQGLFTRSLTSPDPVYRIYFDSLVQDGCARFAQLHNTTSNEQRAFAVKRLQGYAHDAQDLAAMR